MSDVTQILQAIDQGDPHAASQLLPLVYQELRTLAAQKLAQERPGQTLEATALVHEAYLRLVGAHSTSKDEALTGAADPLNFASRRHFFAAAAEAMRRILIDNARQKRSHRYGGAWQRADLDPDAVAAAVPDEELLAVHEALERFATVAPRKAELVKLRYFAGRTLPEVAELLGIALSTAEADWTFAKAWLKRELGKS